MPLPCLPCLASPRLALPCLALPYLALSHARPPIQRREDLYALTKRLSGTNRTKELRPHLTSSGQFAYTIDPTTRYAMWRGAASSGVAVPSRPAATERSAVRPRMAFHSTMTVGGAARSRY